MWRSFPSAFQSSQRRRVRLASSLSRFRVDRQVQEALEKQEPVVALESTIVAHGMPFPQNLELAQEVETILRSKGVVPATIAVKDGVCRVGLSSEELEDLAKSGTDGRATKCSTRELPIAMSAPKEASRGHQWGATTVASTMKLAHMAGISTFVTGGIGGVHRNGQVSMDISADLTELSKTPVVVVSAGIKSILDIRRTLEVLETLGVPTVAFGTSEFPAFFSPSSGVEAPARMDDASQVARAYWASRELELSSGMLVAVPNHDPAGANVERAIQEALIEAEQQGIHGRDVTPFVLREVAEQTKGDSLRSNMALVRQNAAVGADIAIAIAKQAAPQTTIAAAAPKEIEPKVMQNLPESRVIVMGGSVVDLVAKPTDGHELVLGTSNPGVCSESDGGVGRNVAEVLGLLGSAPLLLSAVGNDSRGESMLNRLRQQGLVKGVDQGIRVVDGAHTATYVAVLGETGDLHTAVADMTVFDEILPPPVTVLKTADFLVMDANPSVKVLEQTARLAVDVGVAVCFEPTSVQKAREVVRSKAFMSCISYAFPNVDELIAMAGTQSVTKDSEEAAKRDFETIKLAAAEVICHMHPVEAHVLVTLGKDGVMLASRAGPSAFPQFSHFPVPKSVDVENCTGAGDTLCGAFLHALLEGRDVSDAVLFGIEAASISLQCASQAISPSLSRLVDSQAS